MADADAGKRQVLFIQGGGDNGYEVDAKLVASLKQKLGAAYTVLYPIMGVDNDAPDFGWGRQIKRGIAATQGDAILVGHSVGASILLKYLTENTVQHSISGIFLIAPPFWGYEKWQMESLTLRDDFAARLPKGVPIFIYQAKDDEEVSIAHLAKYAEKLPQATIREIASGGHQLGNDLTPVAEDIQKLK
ncbi:MAG TPA: alpha/beta fold hydrolase [Phototrophicaceae bacterium]|nr:alpha/beta fold hydrolase [Phototrophicaceae bacterium]